MSETSASLNDGTSGTRRDSNLPTWRFAGRGLRSANLRPFSPWGAFVPSIRKKGGLFLPLRWRMKSAPSFRSTSVW